MYTLLLFGVGKSHFARLTWTRYHHGDSMGRNGKQVRRIRRHGNELTGAILAQQRLCDQPVAPVGSGEMRGADSLLRQAIRLRRLDLCSQTFDPHLT